jgi:hypothetical protein
LKTPATSVLRTRGQSCPAGRTSREASPADSISRYSETTGPPTAISPKLKWCDVDKPRETLWDAFKISVASRGGLERSAEALARRIRTQLVANEPLHLPDSLWLAKVISVTPAAGRTVDLENRWPRINSPT